MAVTGRDARLDVFRGMALVTILIDHVPGNIYSQWTLGNWGWSDAAEGFVLMSGVSAGLAYGTHFRFPMRFWTGLAKVLRRTWVLYLTHILITVCGMAATAAIAGWFANSELLNANQIDGVLRHPISALRGIPLLTYQLDYGDILPMYLVLIGVSPLLLICAWRKPGLLLAGSVLVWLLASVFDLNLPSLTRPNGWFFNPLAWQLVFVVGLLTGVAIKDGRRLVPVRGWLQVISALVLLVGFTWNHWPLVGQPLHGLVSFLGRDGWPDYLIGFEKTLLPLPRLLHAFALFYLLSSFRGLSHWCRTVWLAPFAMLGRDALPVFALSSIFVFGMQAVVNQTGNDPWRDTTMLAFTIAICLGLTGARFFWPKD